MEKIEEIMEEGLSILDHLYKNNNYSKVTSEMELKENVMTFVTRQMKNIENQDKLRSMIEMELINKILVHDLNTSELLEAYKQISNEKSKNSEVLLSLFKPSNNSMSNNPLLPPLKGEEETNLNLSPQQRQAIEKLFRVIETMNAKKEEITE